MAKLSKPVKASNAARALVVTPTGLILPYPTVVKVWQLKKNASTNFSVVEFKMISHLEIIMVQKKNMPFTRIWQVAKVE